MPNVDNVIDVASQLRHGEIMQCQDGELQYFLHIELSWRKSGAQTNWLFRPFQNGLRNSVLSTLFTDDNGMGSPRKPTLTGHL